MTSDDIIEMHVAVHAALIVAAGGQATEHERNTCREALQALVKLTRNEYALGLTRDMCRVQEALKD